MNLRNYINWTKSIDDYETAPIIANPDAWGHQELGRVEIPQIDYKDLKEGDQGYFNYRHDDITAWAKKTFVDLVHLDAKIQVQKPGQVCAPHLDFLGDYLEQVTATMPKLLELPHTLSRPCVDVYRLFVALEDQTPGQVFMINGNEWHWRRGDCIRLNNWQALHSTENTSRIDRPLIKITGIKFKRQQ